MKRLKRVLLGFITLFSITVIAVFWSLFENSNSYAGPSEALLAAERDLVLIPAYRMDDKSLYFFINDQKQFGASYIHKGFFGWQAGNPTWSPFDPNVSCNVLNGYQGNGDSLIYGIIRNGGEQIVTLNDDVARILNLELLPPQIVEEYQLNGLYLWYIESDSKSEGEIKLVNKYSEEVLDVVLK